MDLDALDVSKENIQPLRRGRNLSILGTALMAQTDTDVHQQLMKARDQFEILIRSYEGDDPLQHWYDYVLWIEQHFPKQGKEGNLQTLLERCLQTFKDIKEYSQDVRYIDLWTRYMSFVKDPVAVYKQIYSQGIGTECAFLYMCWAGEFENANDFKRADEVYLKGIKKKAQPIEELERAHVDFQLRLARRVLSCGSEEQEELSGEKRSTLSSLRAHGQRKNLVSNARIGNSIQHHKPGILQLGGRNVEKGSNNNYASTSKILVYKDEAAHDIDPTVEPILKNPVFITREVNKENATNAGRWNEGKFKTKNKHHTGFPDVVSSTRVCTFQVHEDECCDSPQVPQSDIGVSNILKTRKMAYDDEFDIPVAIFEPCDETKKVMYPKHKVYSGSTEFSLEELMAISYLNQEQINEKIDQKHSNTVLKYEDLQTEGEKENSLVSCVAAENGLPSNNDNSDMLNRLVDVEIAAGELNSKSNKKQSSPVYVGSLQKPNPQPCLSEVKEKMQSDSSSSFGIECDSRQTKLFTSYIDTENASNEIKPNKKQIMSVYVDNKVDFNTSPKLRSETSDLEVKEDKQNNSDLLKLPNLSIDIEKFSSETNLRPSKKLKYSLHVGSEDDERDILEPKQKTSHSAVKLHGDKDSSSIDHDSRPAALLDPYIDAENPSGEINIEPSKEQKFSVYTDSEDVMNSLLKSKQKTGSLEVKPELCSDNTFELRKKEFNCGKLPGNFLKVPFLRGNRKTIPKIASSIKASTEKDHDQSLTVHTREAWNMMQDLFKSPSASMKYDEGSSQLLNSDPPCVDKIITVSQNPLPTPNVTPFKIFNESSATHFTDKSVSLPSNTFKMPETVDKIDHQNKIKATTILMSANVSEENCINMARSSEKTILSNARKANASHQNNTPNLAENALYNSSSIDSKTSQISEGIPYIRSPGMTFAQKCLLVGTENKENMVDTKLPSSTSSSRKLAGVLEPAKNVYFMPLEEQISLEDKEEEPEETDETCCTAAFARPLFTSTPFLKNEPTPNERLSSESNDTVTMFSGTSCGTLIQDGVSKNDGISSQDKLAIGANGMCILDSKSNPVGSTVYGSVSDKYLSVIQEVTEEKISASSGGSQNSTAERACSRSRDSIHHSLVATFESFNMQKQCLALGRCKVIKRKLEKVKEINLQSVQFSSDRFYKDIEENFFSQKSFSVDAETYVVKRIIRNNFRMCVTWLAWEAFSDSYVALEIYPRLFFWDFYVRRKILQRSTKNHMTRYFLDARRALRFNDKFVVVSRNVEGKSIIDAMEQYQVLMNCNLLEEDLMFLLGEVIHIVDYMHKCFIVHGSLSWQSFCISSLEGQSSSLVLHSYEAAVDVAELEPREQSECFQCDYYSVAKMLYELLFKKMWDDSSDIKNNLEHFLPKSYNKAFWEMMFFELLKEAPPDTLKIQKNLFIPAVGKSGFRKFMLRINYSQ